jgi:hypothetical protein
MYPPHFTESEVAAHRLVAASLATDPTVLRRLAADADAFVREAAARNAACPLDVLTTLGRDPSFGVRLSALRGTADHRAIVACAQDWVNDVGANAAIAAIGSLRFVCG